MVDCGADADMELLTLSSSLLILPIDNRGWREKEILRRTRYIRIRKSSRSILFVASANIHSRAVINF
jgi:hypothetical protein